MIKIKRSHENTVIAYNNSGVPLNRRSQDDLLDLAIIGRKSKDQLILNVFEEPLPQLDGLIKLKMKGVEAKVSNGKKVTDNKKESGS